MGGPSGPMLSSQITSNLCRAGSKSIGAEAPPTETSCLSGLEAPPPKFAGLDWGSRASTIPAGSPVSPKSLVGGPSGPMLSSQIASSLCRVGSNSVGAEAPPTEISCLPDWQASPSQFAGIDWRSRASIFPPVRP
ncbi:DUF6053 domain-containing protein [Lysobacter capsici]|uniref:DUF6053 domain-containing protein n=1 Tax=Lysobacter capsici TaxID=435897 RepID=UPI003D2F8D53